MNKPRIADNLLEGAMANTESDITTPTRAQPTSAITQIANLEVFDSYAKAEWCDLRMTIGDFAAEAQKTREAQRSTVTSSVQRAKTQTGHDYRIETGNFVSAGNRIYIVTVVTRTA